VPSKTKILPSGHVVASGREKKLVVIASKLVRMVEKSNQELRNARNKAAKLS
jgi:hypothetical protein